MLKPWQHKHLVEAGCDEAGRGCLAGPVFAAAVILPKKFRHPLLNDSKKLNEKQRLLLREVIEKEALTYGVASCTNQEIDAINILNASFLAMHRALDQLTLRPEMILVDGNRFKPYGEIRHETIVKGDGKLLNIAAASILAKTYRDDFMENIHLEHPHFEWKTNKGYPTEFHRKTLIEQGPTPYHRVSFKLKEHQLGLFV